MRYIDLPMPIIFGTGEGGRQLVVAKTLPGTYYVVVYGGQLTAPLSYNLTAEMSEITVAGVSPDHHAVSSQCTVTLTGGGFDDSTTVRFVGSDGSTWEPTETRIMSPSAMTALLDLPTWPADTYPKFKGDFTHYVMS